MQDVRVYRNGATSCLAEVKSMVSSCFCFEASRFFLASPNTTGIKGRSAGDTMLSPRTLLCGRAKKGRFRVRQTMCPAAEAGIARGALRAKLE